MPAVGETEVEEFIAWGMRTFPNMSDEEKALVDIVAGILVHGSSEELESSVIDRIFGGDAEFVDSLAYLLPAEYEIGYVKRATVGLAERPNMNEIGYFLTNRMSLLRQRPETLQLFRDLNLPAYWDLYGWPPYCRRIDISEFECE